ncbi:MAG: hypothetical protein AAFR63_11830 [Cyanobacteria bacterium J06631_6]
MTNNYPFVKELITDNQGNINKVIISFDDYQYLLGMLEDQALYRAMKINKYATPLAREEALKQLDD